MDNVNNDPKQALIDKLKVSKNILVTVSANPSVDQLAACLGLTIWLNKLDKHATAVFSGEVPSTLEFLQPEETLEKNTDSLRDFIISLDKSKADKLRYKVESDVVKIFITPYRTSLSADDLEYSQGDFNIDTVIALGVSSQADLDNAITSHGRILHDATVATITTGETGTELGSIQWHDPHASSLSELVVNLGDSLDHQQLDNQIATALLTGIVAETARFSNAKTTPQTMSVSAALMSAGANQQLVVSKLEADGGSASAAAPSDQSAAAPGDGSLEIEHPDSGQPAADDQDEDFSLPEPTEPAADAEPVVEDAPAESTNEEPAIGDVKATAPDDEPQAPQTDTTPEPTPTEDQATPHRITEAPEHGGTLTANAEPEDDTSESSADAMSQPAETSQAEEPLLDHDNTSQPVEAPAALQPAPPNWMPDQSWMDPATSAASSDTAAPAFTPAPDETLAQIEHDVESPHVAEEIAIEEAERPDLNSARDEVMKAIDNGPSVVPAPVEALNAQPIDLTPPSEPAASADIAPSVMPEASPSGGLDLPPAPSTVFDPTAFLTANDNTVPAASAEPNEPLDPDLTTPVEQPYTMPLPTSLTPPPANPVPPTSAANDPSAPPLVPPPLPFTAPNQQQK